ncbi:helix-turn-helix domain-containing protein [Cryobacterium luteum]|uniref:XRE family transcriptional regulator n=1 Tax=Cryobacterium luteum TaxID=1424661 RepID=A0A1H8M4E3_9MICO|nr:helix-turn-helix transcriptional regulator [Cryobacterium luteum]TFB90083.1 XRE family transcriptional regulator [Cryobacterium luteum]SEO12257.1 DNA-binding transcriptional regulator, XRE family [Cryobacterium luteum]
MTARRRISYHWHLRTLMAAHSMWKTTELGPLLRDRRVSLSPAQVYRLVAEQPERLSLHTLAALCDIFDCTPNDLVEPYVEATVGKQAVNAAPAIDISADSRPVRARIIAEEKT